MNATGRCFAFRVGLLAVALLAAACGDSGDDVIGSSSEDDRGDIDSSGEGRDDLGSSADDDGEASGSVDEEDAMDEAADEPSPAPSIVDYRTLDPADAQPDADGSCLVGTWLISQEEMNRWYDGLEEGAGAGLNFEITGTVGVEFSADRTFTYTPTFVMNMTAEGIEASGDTSGSLKGTWSAADGLIVTDITEDSMNIDVRVAGISVDTGTAGLNEDPIVEAPYDCAGDAPVLFFTDGENGRVPMKLTPA